MPHSSTPSGPTVLLYPIPHWLEHLRRGNQVWLAKEQEIAGIEWVYEPPEPNYLAGRVGIRRRSGELQSWLVTSEGHGIDGSIIMQAIEGHVPADRYVVLASEVRRTLDDNDHDLSALTGEVVQLTRRVEQLERHVWPPTPGVAAIEVSGSGFALGANLPALPEQSIEPEPEIVRPSAWERIEGVELFKSEDK